MAFSAKTVSRISAIIDGCSPSVGSSSSSTFGRVQSARPIASICCSPPDSVPDDLAQPLAQPREERQHPLAGPRAVLARHQPDLEVLGDRQLGEEPPALRHPGDAAPRHLVRRQAVEPGGAEPDRAGGRRGTSPMIAFSIVDLPAPLRPITQSDLARRRAQAQAAQHLHVAVAGVEALDREAHGPR